MTRAQVALTIFVGVVAVVAFQRTEQIAQRLGMASVLPRRTTGGIV